MGSGSSVLQDLPEYLDKNQFKMVAGDLYSEELYQAHMNPYGTISKQKVIALHSAMDKTHRIRACFNAALEPNCTTINVKILRELIYALGYEPTAEDSHDPQGNRRINFLEFMNLMLNKMDSHIAETFKVFDVDGDGYITAKELFTVMNEMGEDVTESDANDMIRDADLDGDGRLNLVEYARNMGLEHSTGILV